MANNIYNNKINEFVDWVTGNDLITGDPVTGGLPVSGLRIRELLQERLQMPVFLYENRQAGKYQLFASEEAKRIYENGGNDELLLGEFDGPSAYNMTGRLISDEHVYLSNTDNTQLVQFCWSCIDSASGSDIPTFTNITVTIINNGIKIWEFTDGISSNAEQHPSPVANFRYGYAIDVSKRLLAGINNITVTVASDVYSASTSFNVTYNLIDFSFNETMFNPFLPLSNLQLQVKPEFSISLSSATCSLNAFIDEESVMLEQIASGDVYTLTVPNINPGVHVLTMYMSTTLQGVTYRSNIICKQFVKPLEDTSDMMARLTAWFNFTNNSDEAINNYKKGIYSLSLLQYSKFTMRWGLYNVLPTTTYSSVKFYIASISGYDQENLPIYQLDELVKAFPDVNVNMENADKLEYIPKNTYNNKVFGYIIGNGSFRKIGNILSAEFLYNDMIREAGGFIFKYDAFGKNNTSDTTWTPIAGGGATSGQLDSVTCNVVGVNFTPTNGWYGDSFRTKGINNYILLDNLPFVTGDIESHFAFEIDFMTEYTANTDDELVNIGDFIKIYPNRAVLFDGNNHKIIETNFKAGERAHVTFVKYPHTDEQSQFSDLFLIVTNGIMERGANGNMAVHTPSHSIKIGGAASGIRVYSMRYYNQTISWRDCYNNWIFDAENKADIVMRNMVFFREGSDINEIDELKCVGLMDTILVEGDLVQLVNKGEKLGMRVDSISRLCPTDSTKNFKIVNCWIRTHGQSNIEYPVPSFKIWSNKEIQEGQITIKPELILEKTTLIYCKGRMLVYNDAVPANKWVLQSNFADSSCAHNGTFLRKWHDLTYAAKFVVNGKEEYKLRTPPQLFTSNETITPLDVNKSSYKLMERGYNSENKLWKDYAGNVPFPYPIRQAPNSFPALLFYRTSDSEPWSFFGQYVFMDDKKSDYSWGQRSIYDGWPDCDHTDPFVMQRRNIPYSAEKNPDGLRPEGSQKYDSKQYRIWDNKDCIRIEVLDVDGNAVNFKNRPEGADPVHPYWTTYNQNRSLCVANTSFELIYPDIDDCDDEEIDASYDKWLTFCDWVISTQGNLTKFKNEAVEHMDLYKIAAYYLYFLIFGLVDSPNRNAQWKTYDGVHWWIEPWDMDVALGCQNNGGIAYDPPIDRQTPGPDPGIGAFSGIDSVLWNSLEAWTTANSDGINFMLDIVPAVAQALYDAGLTYDSIIDDLDNYFSLRWPEYIYDKSGEYKYIYSGNKQSYIEPKYLPWLQGARLTHRHWWLATSMDYWFSKLGRGSFTTNHIKIDTNIPAGQNVQVSVIPAQKGYFAYYFLQGMSPQLENIKPGYNGNELILVDWTINEAFSTKKPFYVCGFSNIDTLDIHNLGSGFAGISLNNETELRELRIGSVPDNGNLPYVNLAIANFEHLSYASNLQVLDITGQYNLNVFGIPSTLTHFYGAASSFIKGFNASGNRFAVLHLPNKHLDLRTNTTATLLSLTLKDCAWQEIKFFNTSNSSTAETALILNGDDTPTERDLYTGTYEEAVELAEHDTLSIGKLVLTGKTCSGDNAINSRNLVFRWINSDYAQSLNYAQRINALQLDYVRWTNVTLEQLFALAEFYDKTSPNIKNSMITLDANEHVTPAILAEIQAAFGDGVFTLGSAGITVDYPIDTSVISVGNPAVYDSVNDRYDIDEADINNFVQKCIDINISYVRFHLQDESANVNWQLWYYDDQYEVWSPTLTLPNHSNVSIVSDVNVETEKRWYALRISESNTNVVTEPYIFRLGIQGQGIEDTILFRVTPVTHTLSLSLDNTSVDTGLTDNTLLMRTANAITRVTAAVGGTSVIAPELTWQLNGAVSAYAGLESNENHATLQFLEGQFAQLPAVGVTGTLVCRAQFSANALTASYTVLLKKDALILNSTTSSLLNAFNAALDKPVNNPQLYESDVALVTSLTLQGITNYNTVETSPIFAYMTGMQNLTVQNGSALTAAEFAYFTNLYMPNLTSLTIRQQTSSVALDISALRTLTALTTEQSGTGIRAVSNTNITMSLHQPTSLDLQNVSGVLNVTSAANLAHLKIVNDNYMTYASGHGWIGLIPSGGGILQDLYLSNIKACTSSADQHEIAALAANSGATLLMFDLVSTINVTGGYYAPYADAVNATIAAAMSFGGEYYVLYNNSNHETYAFYQAFMTWLEDTSREMTPVSGDTSLGWNNTSLRAYALNGATGYSDAYKLTLANISSVEFAVKKNRTTTVTENILNDYLYGYTTVDLHTTSVNPRMQVKASGVRLLLGSPTNICVSGTVGCYDCELTVADASNLTHVEIYNIKNPFSTIFALNRTRFLTSLPGDTPVKSVISGTETVSNTQAVVDVVTTGLSEAANNTANLELAGTISATGVIYLSSTAIATLRTAHPNLTLEVSVALTAVDAAMQTAFTLLNIRNENNLAAYTWSTFWKAIYDVMPAATRDTDFYDLCGRVLYAPEAVYMTHSKSSWEKNFDLRIFNNSNITEPTFTNLKLLCYTFSGDGIERFNQYSTNDLPINKYPKIFNSQEGVLFIQCESLKVFKNNSTWTDHIYNLFINGNYGTESSPEHKLLAFNEAAVDGGIVERTGSIATRKEFRTLDNKKLWAMRVYKMMTTADSTKNLEAWYAGTYNYNESDFTSQLQNQNQNEP